MFSEFRFRQGSFKVMDKHSFKVIWSLTLSLPLMEFPSFPCFSNVIPLEGLLHIFRKSTESPDQNTMQKQVIDRCMCKIYVYIK